LGCNKPILNDTAEGVGGISLFMFN
jgi:hypothetical protein